MAKLTIVALVAGLLGGCSDGPAKAAQNIPEAKAAEPLPPGEARRGSCVTDCLDYHRIEVPAGYESVSATVQYSRDGIPETQYLMLSLVVQDAVDSRFGVWLACADDCADCEVLRVQYVFPDSSGGTYYLVVLNTATFPDEAVSGIEINYTISWLVQ